MRLFPKMPTPPPIPLTKFNDDPATFFRRAAARPDSMITHLDLLRGLARLEEKIEKP